MRKFVPALLLAIALIGGSVAAVERSSAQQHRPSTPQERTDAAISFRNDMRKLWEDHITWTRCVIISTAADLPDLNPTTARLLANQTDIGNAIKPYYGTAAGDQLTALLRQHILGAAAILAAAKAGDTAGVQTAVAAWYANADQIAAFLSSLNPDEWPRATVQAALHQHLDLTLNEATHRLGGNYAADIADYDAVHVQILGVADTLSLGIIDEFKQQFVGGR
jgi:hypothetical protein